MEQDPVPVAASPEPIRVFVHLAHGFGAARWQARWARGEIIGVNERLPYGYFWAAEDGCRVEYSEDKAEGAAGRSIRLLARFVFGFDLVHAWRNRSGIIRAYIVWIHSESQHLAVLLLLRHMPRAHMQPIITQ